MSKPGTLAYLAVKFLIEKEYLNQKQNRFNGAVFVPILHLCFNFIPKASKDTSIVLNLYGLKYLLSQWSGFYVHQTNLVMKGSGIESH